MDPSTVSTSRTCGVSAGSTAGEFVVGELFEPHPARLRGPDAGAGSLVRHPERDALAHHPLGDVGGQGESGRRQFGHPIGVERQRRHEPGDRRKQQLELGDRIEDRFLVFLEVPVVGQRLCLERREQAR